MDEPHNHQQAVMSVKWYKITRWVMVVAVVIACVGLALGGVSLIILAHTNASLDERLSCRAQATDKIQTSLAKAFAAAIDMNQPEVEKQVDIMIEGADELGKC